MTKQDYYDLFIFGVCVCVCVCERERERERERVHIKEHGVLWDQVLSHSLLRRNSLFVCNSGNFPACGY